MSKKFIIPEKRDDAIKFYSENLKDIYELKKKSIKSTDAMFTEIPISSNGIYAKKEQNDLSEVKEATATFIANSYLWFDSHHDVHDLGLFKNSIKEQKDRLFHLHDHQFMLSARVGDIKSITEREIDWTDLGINKSGKTEILQVESKIQRRYSDTIFEDYINNKINQHSVSMRYINLKFAIDNSEDVEHYKLYKEYIDLIGNRDEVEKVGYFWLIKEAALREVSCVLVGSNELTHTMNVDYKSNKQKQSIYKQFLNIE